MTNPPPVAPVEGQMFTDEQFADALNQMHVASKTLDLRDAVHIQLWLAVRGIQDHAFIGAQIAEAHEKALALASGELERLRTALNDIFEMWAGSEGFIPHTAPEGYLLELIKKMADRAALAKMEEKS